MSKKTVLSFLTISALTLAAAPVVAEEPAPMDSSDPVEILTPSEPTVPAVDTEQPTQPVNPTTSAEQSTVPSTPIIPSDQSSLPTVLSSDPGTSGAASSAETSSTSSSNQESATGLTPNQAAATDPARVPGQPNQEPALVNQSTATNPPVNNQATDPVTTETGHVIVGTIDSNPIIQNNDGTTAVVAPATVGAVVNADKTVTVKTASGEQQTLPTTGEKSALVGYVSVFVLLLATALTYLGIKRQSSKEV